MPPPRPLRTARDSFPSCSSSLSNAPRGTRCRNVQTLRRLHDTRLEPPHVLGDFAPIHGGPVHFDVRGRTSQVSLGFHLPCLFRWFAKFSRDERPSGSRPAFAWDDVAVGQSAQSLSAPLQGGLRFFHAPIPTMPSASLAVCLPPKRNIMGLPCFA